MYRKWNVSAMTTTALFHCFNVKIYLTLVFFVLKLYYFKYVMMYFFKLFV